MSKASFDAVKRGDLMNMSTFVKVLDKSTAGVGVIEVEDVENGQTFKVQHRELVEEMTSADHFDKVEKCTKTTLARVFITLHNTPITVVFTKADGTQRTLRGRYLGHEELMGRSHVEDFDISRDDKKGRKRLVDHRTIKSIIANGIKYELKDTRSKKGAK